jgi:hypothetical protein
MSAEDKTWLSKYTNMGQRIWWVGLPVGINKFVDTRLWYDIPVRWGDRRRR